MLHLNYTFDYSNNSHENCTKDNQTKMKFNFTTEYNRISIMMLCLTASITVSIKL